MHYNQPIEPKELTILNLLHKRMALSATSQHRRRNLQKGYEGEMRFYRQLKQRLDDANIVLYDLSLRADGSTFQLDCVILLQRDILLLEIKHFAGDFQIKNNKWYALATGNEIKNPLNQMERSTYLLTYSLKEMGYRLPVHAYLLFVHPECTLYQSEPIPEIIHPGQINRFITSINEKPSTLTTRHNTLANALFSRRLPESPYDQLPAYDCDQLQKGVHCLYCNGSLHINGNTLVCASCDGAESLGSAIVRGVTVFHQLFPDTKITTNRMHAWLGIDVSAYRIRQTLAQYFHSRGKSRHMYFSVPDRGA